MASKRSLSKKEILSSKAVYLRPFGKSDLPKSKRWSEDPELGKLIGEVAPTSRSETEKWYRELRADKDRLWFAVVLKEGDRAIGEAGLLRMFKPWRRTDMSMIIGEKDAWAKGYGTQGGRLLLDYAFNRLGFHRVSVGVVGFNERLDSGRGWLQERRSRERRVLLRWQIQ